MTDDALASRAAAEDRAAGALEALEHLGVEEFSRISLSLRDVEDRAPARETAIRAVERAGLATVLDEARVAARSFVTRAFDRGGFAPTGVGIAWSRSRASVDDRVAVVAAAEDELIAAVAAPFVSDDIRAALTTPLDRVRPARPWTAGPVPEDGGGPAMATRWSIAIVFLALVIGSVLLLAVGSGVGLFGLAAAIGIALVAAVMRGRPLV